EQVSAGCFSADQSLLRVQPPALRMASLTFREFGMGRYREAEGTVDRNCFRGLKLLRRSGRTIISKTSHKQNPTPSPGLHSIYFSIESCRAGISWSRSLSTTSQVIARFTSMDGGIQKTWRPHGLDTPSERGTGIRSWSTRSALTTRHG